MESKRKERWVRWCSVERVTLIVSVAFGCAVLCGGGWLLFLLVQALLKYLGS